MFVYNKSELVPICRLMTRLSQNERYEKGLKKFKVVQDPEVEKLVKAIIADIPDLLMDDLETMVNKYHIYQHGTHFAYENPDWKLSDYIEALNQMDAISFAKSYRLELFKATDETQDQEIKERIDNIRNSNDEPMYPTFKDYKGFCKSSEQIFERWKALLVCLNDILNNHLEAYRSLMEKYHQIVLKELENPDVFEEKYILFRAPESDYRTHDIYVFSDLFLEWAINYSHTNNRIYMILGVGCIEVFSESKEKELEEEFYKCLADPTKMQMLLIISKEQLCAKDLADRLKLSKATISYHINRLVLAQILLLGEHDGKKAYYVLNKSKIRSYLEGLMGQLDC